MPESQGADILLVSTADWDNPFWTNKQHVAVELADRGHRVLYVESLALRKPTMTGRDASRIVKRLRRGLAPPRLVRPGLWVWSPIILPLHGSGVAQFFNRMALAWGLQIWSSLLGLDLKLLWTYSPITTNLFPPHQYDALIYHAVDDIKAQPGMPREIIEAAEADLLAKSDIVFVTSQNLYEMHRPANAEVHYFPNVADFDHFNKAMAADTVIPDDLRGIPEPRIALIGAISGYKVDFELLVQVAQMRPHWSIVLIGDVGEGDPLTNADELRRQSNIHLMGPRPYSDLPAYLKGVQVAILANRVNDYTKSMFPMKFFEYLAAGRPVVSGPLNALEGYSDIALFASGVGDYVEAIEATLLGHTASLEQRLAIARENTYAARTAKMMREVDRVLAAKT